VCSTIADGAQLLKPAISIIGPWIQAQSARNISRRGAIDILPNVLLDTMQNTTNKPKTAKIGP